MTAEKPLYVVFAEKVLGWRGCTTEADYWIGWPPDVADECLSRVVPRADLDGYDLGPLIERNAIEVVIAIGCPSWGIIKYDRRVWRARVALPDAESWDSESRREAVLRCLIALADAGRLKR